MMIILSVDIVLDCLSCYKFRQFCLVTNFLYLLFIKYQLLFQDNDIYRNFINFRNFTICRTIKDIKDIYQNWETIETIEDDNKDIYRNLETIIGDITPDNLRNFTTIQKIIQDNYKNLATIEDIIQDSCSNFTAPDYMKITGPVSCVYWQASLGKSLGIF